MVILQGHKYYYFRDGASNHMLFISKLLEDAGHEVIPFSMKLEQNLKTPYEKYFVSSMDIFDPSTLSLGKKIRHALKIFYSFESKKNICRLLQEKKVQVAHLHNIYNHISPSILGEIKDHGGKIVMTLHDYHGLAPNYSLFHHSKVHEEEALGWYLRTIFNKSIKNSFAASAVATLVQIFQFKMMRFYQRYIDVFIAPSLFIKDLYTKYGFDEKKIIHIANPIDLKKFNLVETDKGYVAYVGRLSPEKGVEHILDVAKNTPDILYKIVGTGPLEGLLTDRIETENLQNVEMLGFQTGTDLREIIEGARVLTLPSVWYENNPLSILEGKAMGKIVLGSRIGGIPEMLPETLLFDPFDIKDFEDKIKYWFFASKEQRLLVGKELRKDVEEKNSPEAYLKKLLEIYAR